jgi:hypothetical protein
VKGVFSKTATVQAEIVAVLADRFREEMIEIVDAIEILLVPRKPKLTQFGEGYWSLQRPVELKGVVFATGRKAEFLPKSEHINGA